MKQRGYSLIEILIYVAILAIISVVLTNFFLVSVTSKNEHSARDDIAEVSDDIKLALDGDISSATQVVSPLIGASSTTLVLSIPQDGATMWSITGNSLARTTSSSTRLFASASARIKYATFTVAGGVHGRLGASTTRVEYHIDISSLQENLTRTLEGATLVGQLGL